MIYLPFLVGFSLSYSFCLLFHLEESLQHFFKSKFSIDKVTTLVFACLRRILGYRVFLFSTLNMSCLSLVACKVSAEKSADNLMGTPWYTTLRFSLAVFKILS